MTIPTVVITDHDGNTNGDISIMGPGAVHLDAIASDFGSGDSTNVKIEWDFGDPTGEYNTLRGFNAGHWYTQETSVSKTITCTITNSDGESAQATRTVVITANTRAVQTSLSGTLASNTEFRLDPEAVHTLAATMVGTAFTNVLIRSSVSGTPVTINYTANGSTPWNVLGDGWAFVDVNTTCSGTAPISIWIFGKSTESHKNYAIVRCSYSGDVSAQCASATFSPSGVLVQDCTLTTTAGAQAVYWDGSAPRICVLGGTYNHSGNERALRGIGIGVLLHRISSTYSNPSQGKDALSVAGGDYFYAFGCTFTNTAANGEVLIVGHTSGTHLVEDVVFDRCKFVRTTVGAGPIVAPNTSQVDRCVFRNCIEINCNHQIGGATGSVATNVKRYNSTTVFSPSSASGRMHGSTSVVAVPTGFIMLNCLCVNANMQYATSGKTAGVVSFRTANNLATEVATIQNNVTPVPVSTANGVNDVQIADTVSGTSYESWGTFNARGIADGNRQKNVTLDSNYTPSDTSDSDLIAAANSDMNNFREDHYGNYRPSWIVGAVHAAPQGSNILLLSAGGLTYIWSY